MAVGLSSVKLYYNLNAYVKDKQGQQIKTTIISINEYRNAQLLYENNLYKSQEISTSFILPLIEAEQNITIELEIYNQFINKKLSKQIWLHTPAATDNFSLVRIIQDFSNQSVIDMQMLQTLAVSAQILKSKGQLFEPSTNL